MMQVEQDIGVDGGRVLRLVGGLIRIAPNRQRIGAQGICDVTLRAIGVTPKLRRSG